MVIGEPTKTKMSISIRSFKTKFNSDGKEVIDVKLRSYSLSNLAWSISLTIDRLPRWI